MREHEEMVARIKRQKTTEEDHILTELNYIKDRINQSSRILTDKQKTAFFFVVVPEEMIILDTEKAAQTLLQVRCPDCRIRSESRASGGTGRAGYPALPQETSQHAGRLPAKD